MRFYVLDQDRNEWHGPFQSYAGACGWGERHIGCSQLHRDVRRNWTVYSERERAQLEACRAEA